MKWAESIDLLHLASFRGFFPRQEVFKESQDGTLRCHRADSPFQRNGKHSDTEYGC